MFFFLFFSVEMFKIVHAPPIKLRRKKRQNKRIPQMKSNLSNFFFCFSVREAKKAASASSSPSSSDATICCKNRKNISLKESLLTTTAVAKNKFGLSIVSGILRATSASPRPPAKMAVNKKSLSV